MKDAIRPNLMQTLEVRFNFVKLLHYHQNLKNLNKKDKRMVFDSCISESQSYFVNTFNPSENHATLHDSYEMKHDEV